LKKKTYMSDYFIFVITSLYLLTECIRVIWNDQWRKKEW
jgi:hypothetical protein